MTERQITTAEYLRLAREKGVAGIAHDDYPDDAAAKFAGVIEAMGLKVECLVPPEDIPHILYRILPPSGEAPPTP